MSKLIGICKDCGGDIVNVPEHLAEFFLTPISITTPHTSPIAPFLGRCYACGTACEVSHADMVCGFDDLTAFAKTRRTNAERRMRNFIRFGRE